MFTFVFYQIQYFFGEIGLLKLIHLLIIKELRIYPIALAIYPKVLTVALLIAFLCAFNSSRSSKQIRIHSLAETYSGPTSSICLN